MAKEPRRVTDPYPLFTAVVKRLGAPAPVREYQFTPERKFRFDYAWPEQRVAVEVDGGVWHGGRHTRGAGIVRDLTKMNLATLKGWRVLRFTPDQLLNEAGQVIELLKGEGNESPGLASLRGRESGVG